MSRVNLEGSRIEESVLAKGIKFGIQTETRAAAWTKDRDDAFMSVVTLTGATRIMTLPTAELGLAFLVYNASASALDITVNNPAAATVGTISQNEAGLIYSDGTNWYVSLVGTST